LTEAGILSRLRSRISVPTSSRLIAGIGDDCAVYRSPGSNEDLLFTTDLLIEGVHFLNSSHSPADIGHKVLARGLSDIAAMGGVPRFCLLSLALPASVDARWIDRFYAGLLALADAHSTILAGGDLSRADRVMCDIVCCGGVRTHSAILRSTARPGDAIYVSGALGGSALGLEKGRGVAWRRHLRPEPRLALGRALHRFHVTAAMDLSDGLSIDLDRMCEASGTTADLTNVPIFRGASLHQALHGGEDYELLFTAPPRARIPAVFEDILITRIGTMQQGSRKGVARVWLNREPVPVLGHDHFRK
jgi:thiamine-monophosphate kinase